MLTNTEVRSRVFGARGNADSVIRSRRDRWLGHVARMHTDRLPRRALLAGALPDWRRPTHGKGNFHNHWRACATKDTQQLTATATRRTTLHRSADNEQLRWDHHQWFEHIQRHAADRHSWRTNMVAMARGETIKRDGQDACADKVGRCKSRRR